MAGFVKWLRPRIVVPLCVGSNPTTRPIKIPMTLVIGIFIMRCEDENPPKCVSICGVRARGGRGRRLDVKMAKPLLTATADPFNAAEQDNPTTRPIYKLSFNMELFFIIHNSFTGSIVIIMLFRTDNCS